MERQPAFYAHGHMVIDASNGERMTVGAAHERAEINLRFACAAETEMGAQAHRNRMNDLITAIREARSFRRTGAQEIAA